MWLILNFMPAALLIALLPSAKAQTDEFVQQPTPAEHVDAFNALFGKQHAGIRANHAKGVDLEGLFTPSESASTVSLAPHLQKAAVPVDVRFSNFGGTLASDTDPKSSPRGMSIKFHLPGGSETDLVAHSYNGFPVKTAYEFRDFLLALATTGPGETRPTPLDDFLFSHPAAKAFLEGQITPPASYATVSYFGVNTFKFTNAQGLVTFGRYQIRPEAGDQSLAPDEVSKAGPNYLSIEVRQRVSLNPIRFKLLLEIAEDGDDLDNPSVAWPPSRQKIELGTIEIKHAVADNAGTESKLLFLPGRLTEGIEAEDPMIKVRTDAYVVSYGRRSPTK